MLDAGTDASLAGSHEGIGRSSNELYHAVERQHRASGCASLVDNCCCWPTHLRAPTSKSRCTSDSGSRGRAARRCGRPRLADRVPCRWRSTGVYVNPDSSRGDEHELGRVLDTLLTNALVHTAPAGPCASSRGAPLTTYSSKWPTTEPRPVRRERRPGVGALVTGVSRHGHAPAGAVADWPSVALRPGRETSD